MYNIKYSHIKGSLNISKRPTHSNCLPVPSFKAVMQANLAFSLCYTLNFPQELQKLLVTIDSNNDLKMAEELSITESVEITIFIYL